MDPYIEACGLWGDFHHHLISEIQHALAEAAPERYLVRAGERSYVVLIEQEDKISHPFLPDVSVTTERRKKPSRKKGRTAVAEPVLKAEPVLMRAFIEEEHREAFVEIYEATPEQRLVTCIDVLSTSNKRPHTPGWDLYLRKRQSRLLGDLLRGGASTRPLKGPNRKAQGNALGIEGDLYESALKGRHRTCSAPSGRSRKRRVGTVPSLVPRALPGAFLFGPFRARNARPGAQEDRREPQTRSRRTFHQPTVALGSHTLGEARSGHPPGPSADHRLHLPALSL